MRASGVILVFAILLIVLGVATGGWSQEAKQDANAVAPAAIAPVAGYAESADGLKKLVDDMFVAVKAKDEAKISSYVSALAIITGIEYGTAGADSRGR